MSDSPSAIGKLVALVVGFVVLIGISEVVIRITYPSWNEFYSGHFMRSIHVPDFGKVTVGVPGFDGYFSQNNGDFRTQIQINKLGLRNPSELSAEASEIWVVGDSMAFGWGVEREEIYSTVLGRELKKSTYNIASPGTNVCGYQALIARMPKGLKPRAVVIGLILENDITVYDCRSTAKKSDEQTKTVTKQSSEIRTFTDFKRELIRISALYNFFAVSVKRVDLATVLLTKLELINDIEAKGLPGRGAPLQKAVDTTVFEIGRIKDLLPDGTPLIVLIAPARFEIRDGDSGFNDLRLKVRIALEKAGLPYVDPFGQFKAAGYAKVHFLHDGHWSPLGHKIAAEQLATAIKNLIN